MEVDSGEPVIRLQADDPDAATRILAINPDDYDLALCPAGETGWNLEQGSGFELSGAGHPDCVNYRSLALRIAWPKCYKVLQTVSDCCRLLQTVSVCYKLFPFVPECSQRRQVRQLKQPKKCSGT
jgi:hypothetical protein